MDPILYWNEVALEANRISFTNGKNEQPGPTLSSRALAIVHLAMYDAYAGVQGNPAIQLTYLLIFLAYLVRNPMPQPMLR
jgi:vanadium chloroperoxidase